jgi:hypothetical protein
MAAVNPVTLVDEIKAPLQTLTTNMYVSFFLHLYYFFLAVFVQS